MDSMMAAVSLHCVICFEEFSSKDRAPVVLPCGHTYLCNVCAKKIKRCMECREPLYWTPPASALPKQPVIPPRGHAPLRYGAAARGRFSPTPPAPVPPSQPQEQVPLPLPKNLVLMGMIESAERQARLEAEAEGTLDDGPAALEDDSEKMKNRTLSAVSSAGGYCGTYAVRDPEGVAVLPFDPNRQHHKKEDLSEEKKAEDPREPFAIAPGSTVQIVRAEDGVFKLARGVGYIMASTSQLVKVGGPLEKSCQLEGMLDMVIRRENEVQTALLELQQLSSKLREQIEFEQQHMEDHPVICRPRKMSEEGDEQRQPTPPPEPSTPPRTQSRCSRSNSPNHALRVSPRSPDIDQFEDYQRRPISSPAHSCPVVSARNELHERCIMTQSDAAADDINLGFGCGSVLFGERLISNNPVQDANGLMALSFDDSLTDEIQSVGDVGNDTAQNPRMTPIRRANAVASYIRGGGDSSSSPQAHQESPIRSNSFDGVDFRTGMSCHRGLGHAAKKSGSPSTRRGIRMMSQHSGIGGVRTLPRTATKSPAPGQNLLPDRAFMG